jgi:hypothetical protein
VGPLKHRMIRPCKYETGTNIPYDAKKNIQYDTKVVRRELSSLGGGASWQLWRLFLSPLRVSLSLSLSLSILLPLPVPSLPPSCLSSQVSIHLQGQLISSLQSSHHIIRQSFRVGASFFLLCSSIGARQ